MRVAVPAACRRVRTLGIGIVATRGGVSVDETIHEFSTSCVGHDI